MTGKYTIHTGRNQYGQPLYRVTDSNPAPFDPGLVGHYETEAEALKVVADLELRDATWAATDKAKKLTRGARAQMEVNDYIAHMHSVRDDILAGMLEK